MTDIEEVERGAIPTSEGFFKPVRTALIAVEASLALMVDGDGAPVVQYVEGTSGTYGTRHTGVHYSEWSGIDGYNLRVYDDRVFCEVPLQLPKEAPIIFMSTNWEGGKNATTRSDLQSSYPSGEVTWLQWRQWNQVQGGFEIITGPDLDLGGATPPVEVTFGIWRGSESYSRVGMEFYSTHYLGVDYMGIKCHRSGEDAYFANWTLDYRYNSGGIVDVKAIELIPNDDQEPTRIDTKLWGTLEVVGGAAFGDTVVVERTGQADLKIRSSDGGNVGFNLESQGGVYYSFANNSGDLEVEYTATGGSPWTGAFGYDRSEDEFWVNGDLSVTGNVTGGGITRSATIIVAAADSLDKTHADYVCDGDADDVEINAAIAALPATGGCVLLLDGTYCIADSITPVQYTTLEGQGQGTILKAVPSATLNMVHINTTNVEIRNVRMFGDDGSHAYNVTGIYVTANKSHIYVDYVTFKGMKDGMEAENAGDTDFFRVHGCVFDDISDDGFDFNRCRYGTISSNIFKDIGDNAIDTEHASYVSIIGNTISSTGGHGIELEDELTGTAAYCTITGNTMRYIGGNAIHCDSGSDSCIIGNTARNVTGHGVYIGKVNAGNGGYLSIIGNYFYTIGGDGIKEESGECNPSIIVGNVFRSVTGAELNLTHADTHAWHNYGAGAYGDLDMNGQMLKDPKNTTGTVSGTPVLIEVDIGGSTYYVEAYPGKT